MDLHHFFGPESSSASVAAVTSNSSSEEDDDDFEGVEPDPKKYCPAKKGKSSQGQRKYNKRWEKISNAWNMTRMKEPFVKFVESESHNHCKKWEVHQAIQELEEISGEDEGTFKK